MSQPLRGLLNKIFAYYQPSGKKIIWDQLQCAYHIWNCFLIPKINKIWEMSGKNVLNFCTLDMKCLFSNSTPAIGINEKALAMILIKIVVNQVIFSLHFHLKINNILLVYNHLIVADLIDSDRAPLRKIRISFRLS